MSNYADLIERLESYRPTNEWGDPVHHVIIDEAAACIREMVERVAMLEDELELSSLPPAPGAEDYV